VAAIYVYTIFVLIILGLAYFFYLRDRFQKAVIGHVWATFIPKAGGRVDKLCRIDGNRVIPPPGLFPGNPKPTIYLIQRDKTAPFLYPPLFPRALQATVDSVVYGEGNGEPFDPENNPPVFSPQLMANMQNESSTLQTLRGMFAATRQEDIIHALETAGNNKTAIYISIGLAIGLVALGFFMFKLSGQVGDLLGLYGL